MKAALLLCILINFKQYKPRCFPFLQFHHCVYIWSMFWTTPGFVNKLSVIFKGPGWAPGKPRLGLIEEIPEVSINVN